MVCRSALGSDLDPTGRFMPDVFFRVEGPVFRVKVPLRDRHVSWVTAAWTPADVAPFEPFSSGASPAPRGT